MSRGGPPPRGPPHGYNPPHGHYNGPPPPQYYPQGSPHGPPPPQHYHQPVSPRGPPPQSPVSRFGPPVQPPQSPLPPPPSPAPAPKLFAPSDRPMNREWLAIEEAERQVAMLQRERTARTARMQELDTEIHRSQVALNSADLALVLIDDRLRDLQQSVQAMQSGQLARDYPDPHLHHR